jgi:hypothetical protein
MNHGFCAWRRAAANILVAGGLALMSVVGSNAATTTPQPKGQPIPLVNPSFNADDNGRFNGWTAIEHMTANSYHFTADDRKPHSAPTSARIERYGPEFYGLLQQRLKVPPEWIGKTVRLTGFLKTAGATGKGGAFTLQARGGDDSILAHDHMDDRRVRGDQPWKSYSTLFKLPTGTWFLLVGVMLEDDGTLWADDLALELID